MKFRPLRRTRCGWVWEVTYGDRVVQLSSHMTTILAILYARSGAIIDRAEIEDAIWGDHPDGGPEYIIKATDNLIASLRQRLALLAAPYNIDTVKGRGFQMCEVRDIIIRNGHTRWAQHHHAILMEHEARVT